MTKTIYFIIAVLLAIANGAILSAFGIITALEKFPFVYIVIPGLILMLIGYLLGKVFLD